jgi:hypothetical protein
MNWEWDIRWAEHALLTHVRDGVYLIKRTPNSYTLQFFSKNGSGLDQVPWIAGTHTLANAKRSCTHHHAQKGAAHGFALV